MGKLTYLEEYRTGIKSQYKRDTREIILHGADAATLHGYTRVPNFVLRNKHISANAKIVYAIILSHYHQNKNHPDKMDVFPSQDTICEETGLSQSSVTRAIKELQGAQDNDGHVLYMPFLVVIRRGLGQSNKYVLLFTVPNNSEQY